MNVGWFMWKNTAHREKTIFKIKYLLKKTEVLSTDDGMHILSKFAQRFFRFQNSINMD